MRLIKWIGILASLALITLCFQTWVIIPSKNIDVTGMGASFTNAAGNKEDWTFFGKPGYAHFFFILLFLLFTFIPRVWAKRFNLLVAALNIAWAIRNYFIVTLCRGGECPEKKWAIYALVVASAIMLVAALLPDVKEDTRKNPVE